MKRVSKERYIAKLFSLATPSKNGTPRVVSDPPTTVRYEGAWQVAEWVRRGRVVAQHRSKIGEESRFYIEC